MQQRVPVYIPNNEPNITSQIAAQHGRSRHGDLLRDDRALFVEANSPHLEVKSMAAPLEPH